MKIYFLLATLLIATSACAVFQEIEYKIQLSDADQHNFMQWLQEHATHKGSSHQKDSYLTRRDHTTWHYEQGFRDTDTMFRIRESSNKGAYICYKYCHRDANNMPLYRDEYETSIKDATAVFTFLEAFAGPLDITVVEKTRTTYLVGTMFEVACDEVVGIGNFIEIELKQPVPSVQEGCALIEDFLRSRGINHFVKLTHSYLHMAWNPGYNFKIERIL